MMPPLQTNRKLDNQIALTVKQAAEALGGLSLSYVYRLVQEGVIPSKKVGGRVLISKKKLEEFMETPGDVEI